MGPELLFLLLPVAALSGWWIGRKGDREGPGAGSGRDFSSDYFKGLNYVLNEQSDKAIEVFLRMVEVDSETIDTHFALGSLFRRRGEVDRAIRIHQNLIARPALANLQRHQALFELAWDYYAAGLFDRAENLFHELISVPEFGPRALQQLMDIYEREREWGKAIEAARRLGPAMGERQKGLIAQYYCELADGAEQQGELAAAAQFAEQALAEDANCVRASLLVGRLALRAGKAREAVEALRRVEAQERDYLPEVVQPLRQAYEALGQREELMECLRELVGKYQSTSSLIALAEALRSEGRVEAAEACVTDFLSGHPSLGAIVKFIELRLARGESSSADLAALQRIIGRLLELKPKYRCRHCGFSGKTIYWQCPTCRNWNTLKPIQGIEGE